MCIRDRSICMHEVVFTARKQKQNGVKGLDIAKRLLDYGYHAPTMYFPLIVDEALMVEPTESESKNTLDKFIDAMLQIADECENNSELLNLEQKSEASTKYCSWVLPPTPGKSIKMPPVQSLNPKSKEALAVSKGYQNISTTVVTPANKFSARPK